MKAYRVTLVIIDFDELGSDGVKSVIETTRYPNRAIHPSVVRVEEADIGEWSDDHPLNQHDCDPEAPFQPTVGKVKP